MKEVKVPTLTTAAARSYLGDDNFPPLPPVTRVARGTWQLDTAEWPSRVISIVTEDR